MGYGISQGDKMGSHHLREYCDYLCARYLPNHGREEGPVWVPRSSSYLIFIRSLEKRPPSSKQDSSMSQSVMGRPNP